MSTPSGLDEKVTTERRYKLYQYPDGGCELMGLRDHMVTVPASRLRLEGNVLVVLPEPPND